MAQRGRKPGTTTRTTTPRATTTRTTAARAPKTTAAGTTTRRRRRTTTAPDYTADTAKIIAAVLKNRGDKGANTELLQKVIRWTQEIRTENEAYNELATRPRRRKTVFAAERLTKYELNKALLDGILSGDITLDIQEDGNFIFSHSSVSAPAATEAEIED
jgi:hypothetical protein